jgi:hypothetical protein
MCVIRIENIYLAASRAGVAFNNIDFIFIAFKRDIPAMPATGQWGVNVFIGPPVRETKKNGPDKTKERTFPRLVMTQKNSHMG